MKRQVYLNMKELKEAKAILLSLLPAVRQTELIPVEASVGRVTAEAVFALRSSPSSHQAAMDGIAVVAENTFGTTERASKILTEGDDYQWINTGHMLPANYNAIIMVEKVHQIDENHLEIMTSAYPWQHVRKVGEDVVATQLLLPRNHKVRPYDLGAFVSGGIKNIRVWKKPTVTIIPTGSELMKHSDATDKDFKNGKMPEFNSLMLGALVEECGGIPIIEDIVPDDEKLLIEKISEAVNCESDLVIVNAGSSAGSKDYTFHVISSLGTVLVHGVAIMPGKPTVIGRIKSTPVVGIPGYPVSAIISFENLVKPFLLNIQCLPLPPANVVPVKPGRDITSKLGIEEFVRVNIGKVGDKYIATPLSRAAGAITTITKAEGIIHVPADSEGISQKEIIEAELLVPREQLENTITVIGSHDISIDVLADAMRAKGFCISSANVGSLSGMMALKGGICHMAGSHLLDTETGEYNISFLKRYLPDFPISVFRFVKRQQGFIIPKGNPKNIKTVKDLTRKDISFINRQAGSGTRVLFDFKLVQEGIDPASVSGYDWEEYDHMAIAVNVLSGAADCGMGIYGAAKALDLDFIPVTEEQYDLLIPSNFLSLPGIAAVFEIIKTEEFKNKIVALGGYDPSQAGEKIVSLGE